MGSRILHAKLKSKGIGKRTLFAKLNNKGA